MSVSVAELRDRVASTGWYHSLELAPGVVTPGEFDMRGAVDDLPWPDVRGLRCLDVATFDGFYAFELERRGAAEVVAIDLDDAADLDWLPRQVPAGFARGQEPVGVGFRMAHEAFDSQVERVSRNVYALDPAEVGTFDVVVCGALLQHLRDPFRALAAIRRVCHGELLSVEHVDPWLSLLHRRTPVTRLRGVQRTWSLVNRAGHHHMLAMTGFDVVEHGVVGFPFGAGFQPQPTTLRQRVRHAWTRATWAAMGDRRAAPFSAVRARPAPGLHPVPD